MFVEMDLHTRKKKLSFIPCFHPTTTSERSRTYALRCNPVLGNSSCPLCDHYPGCVMLPCTEVFLWLQGKPIDFVGVDESIARWVQDFSVKPYATPAKLESIDGENIYFMPIRPFSCLLL